MKTIKMLALGLPTAAFAFWTAPASAAPLCSKQCTQVATAQSMIAKAKCCWNGKQRVCGPRCGS